MVGRSSGRRERFCRFYQWTGLRRVAGALCTLFSIAASLVWALPAFAEVYLVSDQSAYFEALEKLSPGDELVLANGEWSDFEMEFSAQGRVDRPVTLRAQTPGKVIVRGRSNLRLSGEHLVVSGLTFRDGFSPTRSVVAFRNGSDALANHTRLTQVVIEDFSKSDRTLEDQWITLYGKNNRVDHSYFAGKTNKGPTLVVRLNTPGSRENGHVIEHNFFGHRPSIGGNGGETLRIGVSNYSRTQSRTQVVRNFFERCDGEVEIISIKAEGNLVAENVFFESRGAVVFRHGGGNEVSRNVFFGNGVPDTGGVRVINDRQTVSDNYFEGLRGEKFLSALTVMNGVPNSPVNRYHQVTDAVVKNNSWIGFDAIGLAVGSDEERSAPPLDSAISNNLFITDAAAPVSVFDDITGISFDRNVSNNPAMAAYASEVRTEIPLVRADNGLLYPTDKSLSALGAPRDLRPISRADTGPGWFEKPAQSLHKGRKIRVGRGAAALKQAVAESKPGDVLKLRGKRYVLKQPLVIPHALTVEGRSFWGTRTRLRGEGDALFSITAGGALTVNDVELVGTPPNKAVILATGSHYQGSYALQLNNVNAAAVGEVNSLPFIAADNATFASKIELNRVSVAGWPGTFIALSGSELQGWYLAEDIAIRDSVFQEVAGPLIAFGREGRDESTFGPRFVLQGSRLTGVNPAGPSIDLRGIDGVVIENNEVLRSGPFKLKKRVLGLRFDVHSNVFEKTELPVVKGVNDEPIVTEDASKS